MKLVVFRAHYLTLAATHLHFLVYGSTARGSSPSGTATGLKTILFHVQLLSLGPLLGLSRNMVFLLRKCLKIASNEEWVKLRLLLGLTGIAKSVIPCISAIYVPENFKSIRSGSE